MNNKIIIYCLNHYFDRVCRLVELLYKSLLHSRSRLYSALSLRPRANKSQPC
uniref:Uncharacterized protein n=1 Tax=Anguilla anguilla TaxID=7936 RepID=A0A0E9UUK5_ANGAN